MWCVFCVVVFVCLVVALDVFVFFVVALFCCCSALGFCGLLCGFVCSVVCVVLLFSSVAFCVCVVISCVGG